MVACIADCVRPFFNVYAYIGDIVTQSHSIYERTGTISRDGDALVVFSVV